MGLFDKFKKVMDTVEKIGDIIETTVDTVNTVTTANTADSLNASQGNLVEELPLTSASRMVEDEECGDGDDEYKVTFQLNEDFRPADSHAGEVRFLHTYAPGEEYGEEGTRPYVAVLMDNDVYESVQEFKEKGTFAGAKELVALGGKFHFKAKKEYYGDMMYFYGIDRCQGFWENNGLCMVYPKSYVGTENEKKMMAVLDEAAETYCEEKM